MDERMLELLLCWEEARQAGQTLAPEELCRDCPELLPALRRHIDVVQSMDWMQHSGRGLDGHRSVAGDTGNAGDGKAVPGPVGRYRLEALLGQGGCGQVWRAFDPLLQRQVAIKVPHRDRPAAPESVEEFLAEARRVAGLRHPGIVPVHDIGREGGQCFIVSALVEGLSLAEYQATGVPALHLAALVAEVASHLHHAHQQGFVHRDLKPANILVDRGGRPYLTDFGIAVSQGDLRAGAVGQAGTLAYMAPELLQDPARSADVRSDVYGLGVVLYEVLTGRRPFVADEPTELREQILRGNAPSSRTLHPAIPERLDPVCRKALALDPARRYDSAAEFAHALRAALARKAAWHRPLLALAVLALLGGAGAGVLLSWPTPASAPSPPTGVPPVSPGPVAPSAAHGDRVPALKAVRSLVGHDGAVVGVAIAPDGRRALSASTDDATSRLWDLERGVEIRHYEHRSASPLRTVLFARNGHQFLYGAFGQVTLRDLESGAVVRSFGQVKGDDRLYLALSADERWLAGGDDTTVTLWDFPSGKVVWQDAEGFRGMARALAFAPDGRRLAVGNRFGPALLYGEERGRPLQRFATQAAVRAIAVLPDNRRIVLAGDDGQCWVWDTEAPERQNSRSFRAHSLRVWSLAVSGDGRRLLTGSEDGTIGWWEVDSGRLLARSSAAGKPVFAVALSPDGRQALSGGADGTLLLWALPE